MLIFNSRLPIKNAIKLAFELIFSPEHQGGYHNWFRLHSLKDQSDNGGRVIYFATQVIDLARIRVARNFYKVSEEQELVLKHASEVLDNAGKSCQSLLVKIDGMEDEESKHKSRGSLIV